MHSTSSTSICRAERRAPGESGRQRSRKIYSLGQKIRVLVDRIDPVEKKIQFAVLEEEPVPAKGKRRKR